MNTALQNRLVGTILVVALAVIFLPDLLDGQKQVQQDIQINIPKPPAPLATHSLREVNIENIKQQRSEIDKKLVLLQQAKTDQEKTKIQTDIFCYNNNPNFLSCIISYCCCILQKEPAS